MIRLLEMGKNYIPIFISMVLVIAGAVIFLNINKKEQIPSEGIPLTPFPAANISSPALTPSPTLSASITEQPTPAPTFGPVTELKIEDAKVGTGAEARSGNTVTVNYIGRLTSGAVFDTSVGKKPFTTVIGVGQVIKGWDQGIPGMKVGGIRRLIIPPDLGYGERGAGSAIPPNSTLIFDVELLDVK